jgi:nucleotide-binding universal stress UspA family protein
MPYKTILVHVDQSANATCRMRLAADIASKHDAHLVGVALTGISRFAYAAGSVVQQDPDLTEYLAHFMRIAKSRSELALEEFSKLAEAVQPMSFEATCFGDEPCDGISLRARYSDLTVISQFDPDDSSATAPPEFPEYVVLNSGCPVLIVPFAGDFKSTGKRPLIAWNGSASATRAVRDALPLLRSAEHADVVVFNARQEADAHGDQPGDDIALFLARHGIQVEVFREETPGDIGNGLLSLAANLESDLIVMGGYGHSRFKEILLGGTTRTILESMTVPVLMSH